MKLLVFSRFIAGLILLNSAIAFSRAEFIQPVAVLASNGETSQDALINGFGLDNPGVGALDSIHSRDASEMWSAVGSINADALFDLGTAVDLTKVYIWNYNVLDNTDRGMKEVEVLISAETNMLTAKFTAIANLLLKEGGETGQVFTVTGTNVRLVKLRGISNWGHGWSVGLAEVRFESGDITGEVPSVVINNPHEADVIPLGTDIVLDAKITDRDSNLVRVEFFDGETLLGTKTNAPHTLTIKAPAKGDHAYRVVASDRSSFVSWATVNVVVREFVADRIAQIDDTADQGDGLNQIQYTGTWNLAQGNTSDPRFNHNDHYSDSRNAYFEVKFKAVKIDLYATVASHHGSAVATIDGGTEYTVNYKASQRREQVLVWSSPILANREHVLRVRVLGNGVVTADRFDIHVSDQPEVVLASIKKVTGTFTSVVIEMEDAGTSVVDPATINLALDQSSVPVSVVKAGSLTTISYQTATPFLPGSTHTIKLDAKDTKGVSVGGESSFSLPKPFFPLDGLGGLPPAAGMWAFRQIWNGGRADALVSAVDIALNATRPGFQGVVDDVLVPYINFGETTNPGAGGLIPDDLPLPAETKGLTENDFVLVASARVIIPRAGDWTIGVHSDDGFALRFVGTPFAGVYGNGERDENFPEFMIHQNGTADSNTRGILRGLKAGEYDIQFLAWERTGGAFFEVYAAEGAFQDDSETWDWQLIGAPSGLQLAAPAAKINLLKLTYSLNAVSIDFVSTRPDATHQLLESADLKNWKPVGGVTFAKQPNNQIRATASPGSAKSAFYRIALP